MRKTVILALCLTMGAVLTGVVAADDRFEPNDNFQEAAQITEGEYDNLVSNDSDYYAIDLQEGETISLSAQGNGDMYLGLYDSSESELAYSRNTKTPSLEYTATQTGTFYIFVGEDFSSLSSYSLNVDIRQDRFEPNHDFQQAAQITEGEYTEINNTIDDSDYYSIGLQEGETISLSAQGNGDMYLGLYDSSESELAYSRNTKTPSLEYTATQTGTFYIFVGEDFSSLSSYSLNVDIRQDRFEPNHDFQQAAQITEGRYENINRTVGESEYFKIDLPDDEVVAISAEGDADTYLELFDPTETSVASSENQQTPSVQHTTTLSGTFYILVDEDYSSLSSFSLDVQVGPLRSAFTFLPENPSVGESVSFDASRSRNLNGLIESYSWDFGDGETATGLRPTHTYDSSGSYTVSLTVADSNGTTATSTKTIQVSANQPPTASFSYSPSNPKEGETVSFDASASLDTDGTVQSYEWNFGDGTTATGETATHSYGSAGKYVVTLTVMDDRGATNTTEKTVEVSETQIEPVANATVSVSPETASISEVGGTEQATVSVTSEQGLASGDVTLSIDTSAAVIQGVSASNSNAEVDAQSDNTVTFNYTDPAAGAMDIDIGTVTFEMTSDVETDTSVQIDTANFNTLTNGEAAPLNVTSEAGTLRLGADGITAPLIPKFDTPPQNTAELDSTLYEDLDGDGDGTSVGQTVDVFGYLIRGNDLGLTSTQASKLDWDEDGGDTVDIQDIVKLFGKQIRS